MYDYLCDVKIMKEMIGKKNEYFKDIWLKFASGWDGAPCSEIACCISYLAGNLDTIPVSNYAEGLYKQFLQRGRVGTIPEPGAFVFFGYDTVPDHTGRVMEVYPDHIVTVEGNINGGVVKRSYLRTAKYIYAYGYPGYADEKYMAAGFAFLDVSLEKGMENNLIFWMQKELLIRGYYTGDLDGDFGSFTETAVKKFQTDHNLVVDGVAGYYTLSALYGVN